MVTAIIESRRSNISCCRPTPFEVGTISLRLVLPKWDLLLEQDTDLEDFAGDGYGSRS
jgi:hypothetical protein